MRGGGLNWLIALLTFAVCTVQAASSANKELYAASIDAGSTGTRIYVYRWKSDSSSCPPTPVSSSSSSPLFSTADPSSSPGGTDLIIPETFPGWTLEINTGISAFSETPEKVGPAILKPLIDFAVSLLEGRGVTKEGMGNFPLFLKATAGVRVLPHSSRDRLMSSVRSFLSSSSPFRFLPEWAMITAGEEEGAFDWLTVNLIARNLTKHPHPLQLTGQLVFPDKQPVGVLDMGGVSAEVTFLPQRDLMAGLFPLSLGGTMLRLYSHSYLYFGVRQARLRGRVQLSRLISDTVQNISSSSPSSSFLSSSLSSSPPLPFPHYSLDWLSLAQRVLTTEFARSVFRSLALAGSETEAGRGAEEEEERERREVEWLIRMSGGGEEGEEEGREQQKEEGRKGSVLTGAREGKTTRSSSSSSCYTSPLRMTSKEVKRYQQQFQQRQQQQQYFIPHPCYERGFLFNETLTDEGRVSLMASFVGTGEFAKCVLLLMSLVPKQDPCWTPGCSFAGVYQPRLLNHRFVALAWFTTTFVEHLGMPRDASLTENAAAARKACSFSALQQLTKDSLKPVYPRDMCSNAVWSLVLLVYGYGFPLESQQIRFIDDPGQLGDIVFELNRLRHGVQHGLADQWLNPSPASIAAVSEAQKEARAAMAAARRWKLLAIGTVSTFIFAFALIVPYICSLRKRLRELGWEEIADGDSSSSYSLP